MSAIAPVGLETGSALFLRGGVPTQIAGDPTWRVSELAKMSAQQKAPVIKARGAAHHNIGILGAGVNRAPALARPRDRRLRQ
jgi:hypothetical protein